MYKEVTHMCQHCSGVRRYAPEYKALKEDQNGSGVVKIQGRPVQFIKQGNRIIVKQHLVTDIGEVVGICEKHDGDAYRCKLGVKISLAKALKKLLVKERELHEQHLQPIITQYDSLVEEITQAMPDTTLKRIRPKRSISE
jgi:hypothetical protein